MALFSTRSVVLLAALALMQECCRSTIEEDIVKLSPRAETPLVQAIAISPVSQTQALSPAEAQSLEHSR